MNEFVQMSLESYDNMSTHNFNLTNEVNKLKGKLATEEKKVDNLKELVIENFIDDNSYYLRAYTYESYFNSYRGRIYKLIIGGIEESEIKEAWEKTRAELFANEEDEEKEAQ